MNPKLKTALYAAAVLWIVVGTASYCFYFTRDFYAANAHRIHALLERIGR